MKTAAFAVMLALAIAPISVADQGQSKPKEKEKTTQTKSKGQTKSQGKAKGKAGRAGSADADVGGVAACSPDATAPVINSVSATPNVLLVPNHRMMPVTISANVTDNCPGAVTWAVTSITSDEPVNGTGDGDTEPDWAVASPHAVQLRAERAGTGDGRVYTITITASDAANNTSTAVTTVTVPHNR